MKFSVIFTVVLLSVLTVNPATSFRRRKPVKIPVRADGCVADLNANDFPEPDPLILRPDITYDGVLAYEDAFVLPSTDDGLLHIATGESVRIACPGGALTLTGQEESVATCTGSNKFQINGQTVAITKLTCKVAPTNTALRKDICSGGATGVELGFKLDTFYPLIYTCFDEDKYLTHWSLERVAAELKGYETGENSPSFKEDDFYPDIAVDTLYGYDNQVVAFTKLLGSKTLATNYLKDRNSYFLARGHFAPRADFVFGAHTRATFHFINVGPQWQIFNGGAWNNIEMAVRDYAIKSQKDLIAYTGPWGVLSYPDINNNLVELYLANPGTASQSLQVPKFYWKLVIDVETSEGVVFVGINDPFVDIPLPADYVLCKDVLPQISWVNIKDTKWLYACNVEEFISLSDTFPQVQVSGLLTG